MTRGEAVYSCFLGGPGYSLQYLPVRRCKMLGGLRFPLAFSVHYFYFGGLVPKWFVIVGNVGT